jgi:excisionase family DNA binding protein
VAEDFMTVDEVAKRAKLSAKTLRRAIRSGELAAYTASRSAADLT